MNIAFCTIYGNTYAHDAYFNVDACGIGQNLLLPNKKLKEALISNGNTVHTADCYKTIEEIDKFVFVDVPFESIIVSHSVIDLIKYFVKGAFLRDYFLQSTRNKKEKILLIVEPKSINKASHDQRFHKYFNKIITWEDDIVDNKKYFKYFIPQVKPDRILRVPFENKKDFVMMNSNKTSNYPNELYSERKRVIEYFENNNFSFDLFGYGWEKQHYKSYAGISNDKLKTLSNYKYVFCYENEKDSPGYITEKIFDAFFAGCVPIYLGANNIEDFISSNTFIDARSFSRIDDMIKFVNNLKKDDYELYLQNINVYLNSKKYLNTFDYNNFVRVLNDYIIN